MKNAVKMALDAGYRAIDTAVFYMNEASIGEAIAKHEVDRKDIFITSSKERVSIVFIPSLIYEYIKW